MMMRKVSTRVWHLDHIGTGIVNWLRAGQYENSGLGGWRWPLSAFTAVSAMVSFFIGMITSIFGLSDRSPYDFETVLKMIYHMIFILTSWTPRSPGIYSLPCLSAFVCIFLFLLFHLKEGMSIRFSHLADVDSV